MAQDSSGLKAALLRVAAVVTSKQIPGAPKDDACCVLMSASAFKIVDQPA